MRTDRASVAPVLSRTGYDTACGADGAVFYQSTRAFLIGKVEGEEWTAPFAIVIENIGGKVRVETVLMSQDDMSILFGFSKTVTRKQVLESYRLVSRHDRVGRLIDTQAYRNIELPAGRFPPDLLDELVN